MPGSTDILLSPNIVNVGQTFILALKPKPNRYIDYAEYTYTEMGDSTYAELGLSTKSNRYIDYEIYTYIDMSESTYTEHSAYF